MRKDRQTDRHDEAKHSLFFVILRAHPKIMRFSHIFHLRVSEDFHEIFTLARHPLTQNKRAVDSAKPHDISTPTWSGNLVGTDYRNFWRILPSVGPSAIQ